MNNRVRNLIEQISFLMQDGKIGSEDAYKLMQDAARVGAELAEQEYLAYAREAWLQRSKP